MSRNVAISATWVKNSLQEADFCLPHDSNYLILNNLCLVEAGHRPCSILGRWFAPRRVCRRSMFCAAPGIVPPEG